MKARKKLDRIFALLLVFTLIFNSQATALLAMEGEPVTEIAGSEVTPLSGTEGEQEIIDDNTVVIPDGEAAGDPAESVTQPEAAQGGDLVLDEESVPGSDSTSGQGDDSSTGQENAGENVAGTQELEPEPESKTEQPADAEPEIGQADPSISEPENEQTAPSGSEPEAGQETLSGSATEDGTGADEESGPAVDVESDSDITIVEEETEPQTLEQGTDTQEPEEKYEAEVVAMGLDDEIMLTGLDDLLPSTLPQPDDVGDGDCECRAEYEESIAEWEDDGGDIEEIEDYLYLPDAQIIDAEGNPKEWHYLACATKKVQDGQTIRLFFDELYHTYNSMDEELNIDLKGKHVTLDLNQLQLSTWFVNRATINVENGELIIKNGEIEGADKRSNLYSAGCIRAKNASIVLENVTFNSSTRNGKGGAVIYQTGGSLTMTNVKGSGVKISDCENQGASFMFVEECKSVYMKGVELDGEGAYAYSEDGESYSTAFFRNCDKIQINGLSFTKCNGGNPTANKNKDGVLRFSGCPDVSINDLTVMDVYSASAVVSVLNGSNVNLSGSTLSGNLSGLGSVYVGDRGNILIANTTIEGDSNGLYVDANGNATMESGALYKNKKTDVIIEKGATADILAVSEMTISDELTEDYNLWTVKDHPENNKKIGEKISFEQADDKYEYIASAVKPDVAQITRGEEVLKYQTLADAVKAAQNDEVIQLLPDILEGTPKKGTIKVQNSITLDKSVTLDLNGQELAFSDKSAIKVANGVKFTVMGPGEMTGGFNSTPPLGTGLEETIQVGEGRDSSASLIITNNAYVNGVKNCGSVMLENDAQVSQIDQFSGKFILDTKLKSSLNVVLELGKYNYDNPNESEYESLTWLTTGEHFEIGDPAFKINFKFSAMDSLFFSETHINNWLQNDGVNNSLVLFKGEKLEELAKITDVLNVSSDKTIISTTKDAVILLKNEGIVYLGGNEASDDNPDDIVGWGYIKDCPVASMEKAIELARNAKKKIYLVGAVDITEDHTWDLSKEDGITIERWDGYKGPYAKVSGGTLTLTNIAIKGDGCNNENKSDYALIEVTAGGKLVLGTGAVLSDNNHDSDGYYTCGGAVENNGGTIEIDGGTIKNCKAYNGGAIYCDGGNLVMNSGELSGNSAKEAGGAVMLANGAEMELIDGKITENNVSVESAEGYGGGIAVGGYRSTSIVQTPVLIMNGGEITNNRAYTCGGGIFVQANAKAEIHAGVIDDNTAYGSGVGGSFSGGGIYVNGIRGELDGNASHPGYLYLENVLITGNTSEIDAGGGIAACPTASAEIYLLDGAAIYGNKHEPPLSDSVLSDILIRRGTIESSGTNIDVSEYMPNGQPYLWKEYYGNDDSAVERLHRNDDMTEYNLYTEEEYSGDLSDFSVFIRKNTGGQAGGGIGTNGTVVIGTRSDDIVSISAKKVWVDAGRESNRPEEKIKVWLLSRIEGGEFKRVAAGYLEPDASGNWGSATVTFPEQPKYDPKTGVAYEYTVKEDTEGEDIGPYVSTVTKGEGDVDWVITNTYTPAPTKAKIEGTKVLEGREWKDTDEFTFTLTETTKPGEKETAVPDALKESPTKTVKGTQEIKDFKFDEITYTKPYVHTYKVVENDASIIDITEDPTYYLVTVTVTDDGVGALSASVSYSQVKKDAEGKETEASATKAVFTNTYTPVPTKEKIEGTKVLTGREWKASDEFTFELKETTEPKAEETAVPDALEKPLTATVKGTQESKDFNFGEIVYTKPYVHTYEVTEQNTTIGGIVKDPTSYLVTVNVTDNGTGTLSASVIYSQVKKDAEGNETATSATNAMFTNTYIPTSATATIAGTKVLTGREWKDSDEFTFTLTETTEPKTGETVVPDKLTEKTATATSAQKNFSFGPFTYTKPYVHTYEVKETSVSGKGIKVDEKKYTVTVNVTDDGNGKLSAAVSYPQTKKNAEGEDVAEDKVIFTNTYTAASCEATVSATKKLTGRANGLQDKEFSFSLTPVSAVAADGKTEITDPNMDAEMNPGGMLTASNDGDGNVTFEKLTYTQAGTYTYELKEEATAEAGITKDPSVYTVTVSVTDDGLGNLHADVKYSKDGKEVAAADVAFENVYDAEDTSIRLGATKVFDRALTDGEFTFALREVDQNGHAVEGGISREAVNGKDGSVLFDPIPYDKEGTYYYQISETAGNDPTVLAYDAAVYTVTVTVKDVDAKLVATAVSPDKVTFTNTSTKAYLDKQDAETGAGIPGAVLRIVDKSNGAVVEEWTSDGKPHEVLGKLSKNGSYALEEVSAPDGYMPTGPADFTMNEKGEIVVGGQITDTVVMKDTKNTISLLKLDEAGQPLPGAHLVIEDATGTAVDNWVSDGTPHVTRGLARGHYVMSEVEAPAGYHVSEDVPFEITGNETQPVEVQMTDTKIPERDNNKLTVMKHLQLDGITCDIGIHDAVFYVALFDDEAKTHRVSDVKALTFKDSAISTAEFENLGKGTYYLGETDENGVLKESEVVNDRVIYYAQYGENAKVEFEGRKGEATSELTNVYVEVPEEGFYLSGRLTITKKVLLNGTEATSEDTFYARVFSDAALTSPNSDVVALAMNGGSTASVTVYDLPIGETLESSATYYVAETDKNGTPLDPDAVTEYRISIDKSEIVLNAENSNQEVTITNDFIEEEDETETETDLPDEPGATPNSGTSAPKTGDETNLLLYLFYMMLSAGLFAVAAGEKRRRRNRVKK